MDIPADPGEREALFSSLGVFIEHSDGEKVLIPGYVVEYSPGLWGLEFSVDEFSLLTIVRIWGEPTAPPTDESSKFCKNKKFNLIISAKYNIMIMYMITYG